MVEGNIERDCEKVAALLHDGVQLSAALRRCDVKAAAFRRWQKQTEGSALHKLWDAHAGRLGTADAVHATLREAIISGVLKPDDKLGEEYLADAFKVSRTPVREALARLSAERLAVRMPHRGFTVRSVSEIEVLDFYAVRVALDGLAAKLAARQALPSEVTQLHWLNDRMAKAPDLTSQHDFSVQFHVALYQASHNRLLQHFGNEMLDWQRGFSASTFADQGRLTKAHRDHAEIVDAIEKHDERRAEKSASSHMMNALEARADKMGLPSAVGKTSAAKGRKKASGRG